MWNVEFLFHWFLPLKKEAKSSVESKERGRGARVLWQVQKKRVSLLGEQ